MLIDYMFYLFQEIITLIKEILFQTIMYRMLKLKIMMSSLMEKSFFDLPVKNEEETYEKIIDMSNNNDYTTGNLLDFAYFKENYKLIAIDLSKQTKLKDPQQIDLMEQQCSLLLKNQKKLLLIFHKILPQLYK